MQNVFSKMMKAMVSSKKALVTTPARPVFRSTATPHKSDLADELFARVSLLLVNLTKPFPASTTDSRLAWEESRRSELRCAQGTTPTL
jgi:hypothetical protein